MATSGNYNSTFTRDTILEDAAEIGGILDPEGVELSARQKVRICRYLNNMIKSWQADGMQVWIRKNVGIVLQKNVSTYSFNWEQQTFNPRIFSGSYIQTTLSSGSGTTIQVADTGGMSALNSFGSPTFVAIERTNGSYFYANISSIDSVTQITLSSGGTDYLVGGYVYYYTILAPRLSRIYAGYVRSPQGFDTPVRVITRDEYNLFGVKTTPGQTVQVFYDMGWPTATLRVYPTTNVSGYLLFLEGMYPFQVFTEPSDMPDFPEEWINAIVYGLAEEIAFRYGMDEKRLAVVAQKAKYWRDMALGMSQENSIYMQPEANMYGQK